MHSFFGKWHCRTTSSKEPWHTVHGLNPINVTADVESGLHGTQVHTNADKWLQMLCDVGGVAYQGKWLGTFVLPLGRFQLLGHTQTPSQLVPGMNTGPLYFYSMLFNSNYLQHTQPTLQVMRDCHQCHLFSGHRMIWTFMLHFQSGITSWSLSVNLKFTLYIQLQKAQFPVSIWVTALVMHLYCRYKYWKQPTSHFISREPTDPWEYWT